MYIYKKLSFNSTLNLTKKMNLNYDLLTVEKLNL